MKTETKGYFTEKELAGWIELQLGQCGSGMSDASKARATARQMFAAPDLLAAAEAISSWIDSDPDAYVGDDDDSLGRVMYRLRAAITKASQ